MLRPLRKDLATRLSISLPESVAQALDRMVVERGFTSRSQAVSEMVHEQLVRHEERLGNRTMAGTINITYDRNAKECGMKVAGIQHKFLHECIASLHVQLEEDLTLEVVLVQGQGKRLRQICDSLLAIKGVLHGSLNIHTHILPPLEP